MSKEIAKKQNAEVAEQNTMGRGFEKVDMNEITMPVAKLLQPISEEVSMEDYDFKAGQIVHSLLFERLSDRFVPIMLSNSNIFLTPKNDDAKKALKASLGLTDEDFESPVICKAPNGKVGDKYGQCSKCELNKWHGSEKPICTSYINVLAMFDGQDFPVVIRFGNTSYKHGKKFRDMALFGTTPKTPDLFHRAYRTVPAKKTEGGNTWFELTIKPAGLATEEEHAQAEALYNQFAKMTVVVEEDKHETEEGESEY